MRSVVEKKEVLIVGLKERRKEEGTNRLMKGKCKK